MPLWNHQDAALTTLRRYLREGSAAGAALISMPTGSGKSAVIASLVASTEVGGKKQSALVVTPWSGLTRQILEDIDDRVWQRLEQKRPENLARVEAVRSAAAFIAEMQSQELREPKVYVTTLAMVLQIYKTVGNDSTQMASLFQGFATVVVDECHYEPAPGWSRAVRATGLPICLFTATPFRNDNRMFVLDEDAHYRYSHLQAVKDRVLREPTFLITRETASVSDYVDDLLGHIAEKVTEGERVIVRCGNRASVEAVARTLSAKGRTVVAVHEAFVHDEAAPYLRRSVPAPSGRPDAQFLVHQHKLTEGFDDPSVKVLAVYEGFGNDRSRIQQVGRILRNPTRAEDTSAFVLSADATMQEAWERYRKFDAGDDPKSVATDPAGVAELLDAQPEIFYWDRLFREQADLRADEAWKEIKFRLSTSIRRPIGAFGLDSFAKQVEDDLACNDRQILSTGSPDEDTRVFLHLSVRNSPILREAAFVEMALGYTVLHWNGEHLFVSDSDGLPESVRSHTISVGAGALVGLLPSDSTVTSMSLTNNDLSDWSVRSRSLSARDVALVAAEVGDSTFGYSTASGTLVIEGNKVGRYTGVKNGRVSDSRSSKGHYPELRAWFDELSVALQREDPPASAIARYGLPVTISDPPIAAHVLLDLAQHTFEPLEEGGDPLVIDCSGGVAEHGQFEVEINGSPIDVSIRWDSALSRFELSSARSVPYRSTIDPRSTFWQFVTREQLVKVATAGGLVYSNRNFWSMKRRNSSSPDGLLSILETSEELSNVVGEKGHADGAGPWPSDTVFGQIDDVLLPQALGTESTVLCTDLGSEIADFVGFNEAKVVFAHAKSKKEMKPSRISGAALHDVVSQATKSLRFLTIGNQDRPATKYWADDWSIQPRSGSKATPLGPAKRLRRGAAQTTGEAYWDQVDAIIQSHAAEREVWLVLGACLSKSALSDELAKENPKPVALQVHALLTAAWSAAQQCGIRLRVFCSE
ncbi:DEAD/DEAH box helicase [Arthrobacter sp. Z4-13]